MSGPAVHLRLRRDAAAVVRTAIRASEPGALLSAALARHPPPETTLNVVAAGKAGAAMADAFLHAHGSRVREVVVTEGGHPIPDERSVDAGRRALALARASAARGDTLVVLLSGGASAMIAVPAGDIRLADKAALTRLLLTSGLPIAAMNAVRKHVSAVKGGWLGAAAARSMTYALSDVHAPREDDPSVIGSGPTVPDPSTYAEAIDALQRSSVAAQVPPAVMEWLREGARGAHPETPKPGDPRLASSHVVIAGNRQTVIDAAAREARARDYEVATVSEPMVGETREVARAFVTRARGASRRPLAIIGGGETTVTFGGERPGRGGRNQEFALAAALDLPALAPCTIVSAGTDGVDGPTDAAGAFADDTTLTRAAAMALDARDALRRHASYDFFARLDDLLVTGPTGTNLGDLHVLLLMP